MILSIHFIYWWFFKSKYLFNENIIYKLAPVGAATLRLRTQHIHINTAQTSTFINQLQTLLVLFLSYLTKRMDLIEEINKRNNKKYRGLD